MARQGYLGEFEQLVLLAVLQLEGEAYAPEISRLLENSAARQVSRGALYSTLDRLEAKGFVRWRVEAPGPERGGHRKRLFEVTAEGVEVLRDCRETLMTLWKGLDQVLARTPRT